MAIYTTSAVPTTTNGMIPIAVMAGLLENGGSVSALDEAISESKLSKGHGKAVQFRRFLIPAASATPETEGVNPAPRALIPVDYIGTLQRYSEIFQHSTYAQDTEQWDIGMAEAQNLKVLIRRTRELVRWNAVKAGSNVLYNSSSITSRGAVNGQITRAALAAAIRILDINRGVHFSGALPGSTKVGTAPVEPSFMAFCHTDCKEDLKALPGFLLVSQYGSGKTFHENEYGACAGVRFILAPDYVPFADAGAASTTMISTTGTNADVYPIVIFAKNAFNAINFMGSGKEGFGNLEIFRHTGADKSDMTNARQATAAAWYDLVMPTNQDWVVRIEVAVRKNPT